MPSVPFATTHDVRIVYVANRQEQVKWSGIAASSSAICAFRTKRQGESGLGLEAQRASVEAFLNGGSWQLVEELVEIETGKDDRNRPALHQALDACKVYGATLVIAKLDRLSS